MKNSCAENHCNVFTISIQVVKSVSPQLFIMIKFHVLTVTSNKNVNVINVITILLSFMILNSQWHVFLNNMCWKNDRSLIYVIYLLFHYLSRILIRNPNLKQYYNWTISSSSTWWRFVWYLPLCWGNGRHFPYFPPSLWMYTCS